MRTGTMILFTLISLSMGCSDDSSPSDSGPGDTSVTDASQDQQAPDAAPPLGSITVTVLKADNAKDFDFTTAPAAGATVAADLPGGTRVEQTVPTDGKLTIDNINWSSGTLALTAFLKGYRLFSTVGLTQDDGDQSLYLVPLLDQSDTITISGTAKNLVQGASYLAVGATGAVEIAQGTNKTSYSLQVPKNQAGTVLGVQAQPVTESNPRLFGLYAAAWAKADYPASDTPATVDLDFGTQETPVSFKTTFELPTDPSNLAGSASRPEVYVLGRGLLLGLPTAATMNSATNFTLDGEYVKVLPEAQVFTRYFLFIGSNGYGSYKQVAGYPQDATVNGFHDVPKLVSPAEPLSAWPFYDRLQLSNPEAGARLLADIEVESTGEIRWMVRGPLGGSTAEIPLPPSTATAADIFGSEPVVGRLGLASDWDETRIQYMTFSVGRSFALDPTLPQDNCAEQSRDGKAYAFCKEMPWTAARIICGNHNMRPARVDDAAENDWIEATALSQGMNQPETMGLWLGGSDRDSEGTWRWADGEVFYSGGAAKLYANFDDGQPDNDMGNEHCLMTSIGGGDAGRWNDATCSGSRYVVCEAY